MGSGTESKTTQQTSTAVNTTTKTTVRDIGLTGKNAVALAAVVAKGGVAGQQIAAQSLGEVTRASTEQARINAELLGRTNANILRTTSQTQKLAAQGIAQQSKIAQQGITGQLEAGFASLRSAVGEAVGTPPEGTSIFDSPLLLAGMGAVGVYAAIRVFGGK